ncbi:MAG TPA: DUF1080 domain-containing protein [Chthonomonadales bacterium]|nr:DUF1080 domain-containing protein [Chthonomonadales bacterium]
MRSRNRMPGYLAAAALLAAACSSNGGVLPRAQKKPGKITLLGRSEQDMRSNWVKRGTTTPAAWAYDNGVITSGGGDIVTRQTFRDFLLHVEWKEPYMPNAHGQGRGNSGVGLLGLYEIQVLDSYGIADPGRGDCGAVYDRSAPLVNACKPPLKWQTYDILFRAPRFDADGKKVEDARVSVIQNGIVVQNNTDIPGVTGIAEGHHESPDPGPILLQDHGNKVSFRDIWIIPLPESGANHY